MAENKTEFKITMDPHAEDIVVDGRTIGSLQWHPERPPRAIFEGYSPSIPLSVLEAIVSEHRKSLIAESLTDDFQEKNPYVALRRNTRSLLSRVGVSTNPGSGDVEVINLVRRTCGLDLLPHRDELAGDGFEPFRDDLIRTLQEAGVDIVEPITEVSNIYEALGNLLQTHLDPQPI